MTEVSLTSAYVTEAVRFLELAKDRSVPHIDVRDRGW